MVVCAGVKQTGHLVAIGMILGWTGPPQTFWAQVCRVLLVSTAIKQPLWRKERKILTHIVRFSCTSCVTVVFGYLYQICIQLGIPTTTYPGILDVL